MVKITWRIYFSEQLLLKHQNKTRSMITMYTYLWIQNLASNTSRSSDKTTIFPIFNAMLLPNDIEQWVREPV